MTVEVALSLMAGARVDHLVLCDGDDQSTGLITLARLAVLRDSPTYTDRIRLRDVLDGPFTPPGSWPDAVREHGRAPGRPHPRPLIHLARSARSPSSL
ncbi:CBS domain-containing protein [Streptomyces sparsogenes]